MNYTMPEFLHSALITVDTQCDFVLPGAVAEIPGSMAVIGKMKSLLQAYRKYNLPVVHLVRLYLSDGSNVDLCRRNMVENGTSMVAVHSEGAELVADLKPDRKAHLDTARLLEGKIQQWAKNEVVIFKPRWGGFYQTPLDKHLRSMGITTLVVCGCNFPNCPRTTIYEASERDYKLVLVEDAISGIYSRGREELQNIGVKLLPTNQTIAEINAAIEASNC